MNRTVLPDDLVADFSQLVTTLLPKPATRDVKALAPFTDAIQDKIKDAGAGTAKWAVRFAQHLENVAESDVDDVAPASLVAQMPHPDRAVGANAN
jgi:hypothetical protein